MILISYFVPIRGMRVASLVDLWADSPERAFIEKTSTAIMVLLGIFILMNVVPLWAQVGMVFQKPNPFPKLYL